MLDLLQIKLIGVPYGLCSQEVKDLWHQADIDGNGVLDFEEFKVYCTSFMGIFCPHRMEILSGQNMQRCLHVHMCLHIDL